MCSPEDNAHWSIQDYIEISPKTNFKTVNSFADEDETSIQIYQLQMELRF
jgi:hypothetical protein